MKPLNWLLYIASIGILIGFTGYTTPPVKTKTTDAVTAKATPEGVKMLQQLHVLQGPPTPLPLKCCH